MDGACRVEIGIALIAPADEGKGKMCAEGDGLLGKVSIALPLLLHFVICAVFFYSFLVVLLPLRLVNVAASNPEDNPGRAALERQHGNASREYKRVLTAKVHGEAKMH